MKETLCIDMDNTLNKLWISFYDELKKTTGIDKVLSRDELFYYRLTYNIDQLNKNDWFYTTSNVFNKSGFWLNIPAYEDISIIEKLIENFNVYILTKPWLHSSTCIQEKLEWIKKYLPFFDLNNVIFTGHKHLVRFDYLIDDAPDYMKINDSKIIAMDYPYNREYKTFARVKNWNDIAYLFNV